MLIYYKVKTPHVMKLVTFFRTGLISKKKLQPCISSVTISSVNPRKNTSSFIFKMTKQIESENKPVPKTV